jgi:hypothetical protein
MTAATTDRATKESWNGGQIPPIPLTAATKIPGGVIVMIINGTGTALNGANTASGLVQGVSTQLVDTTLGHTVCPVKTGRFWFANDGTLTAANIGQMAVVIDNVTVGATSSQSVLAGIIKAVDAVDGVLIDMTGAKIGAI